MLQVVRQCNEGARKMSNIEQITEIDRMLVFNKAKVSLDTLYLDIKKLPCAIPKKF